MSQAGQTIRLAATATDLVPQDSHTPYTMPPRPSERCRDKNLMENACGFPMQRLAFGPDRFS
jgi:hypothetical protein